MNATCPEILRYFASTVHSNAILRKPGLHRAGARSLLAATDDRFNFYSGLYPDLNVMVCKDCSGSLNPSTVDADDGGFHIFVGGAGQLTNNGDGGFENWQFRSCPNGGLARSGFQGHTVDFQAC